MMFSHEDTFIDKDEKGVVRSLDHLDSPYVADVSSIEGDAVSVSQQYLRDAATIYGIPEAYLNDLNTSITPQPGMTDRSTPALNLAGSPRPRHKCTVVSYQQTVLGLPIWEAGFSITLDEDLNVISSVSTIEQNVKTRSPQRDAVARNELDEKRLRKLLGIEETRPKIVINTQRLMVYKFNPSSRLETEEDETQESGVDVAVPTLELPPVRSSIEAGAFFVCREILFTWPLPNFGDINWRVFVEVDTGSVLYLRALMASIHAFVYTMDPFTRLGATGPPASAPVSQLDNAREWKELPEVTASSPQQLAGRYVRVRDFDPPAIPPPTSATGHFRFSVPTDGFAASNAYYQMARLFKLLEELNFDVRSLFDSTAPDSQFPLPVDHRGFSNAVNAKAPGNSRGDGSGGFIFGLAASGTSVGMASDFRVAAHEFCHALLWEAVHSPNFGFAHSAGDALGSIFCDPVNKHPDRFNSFPWITIGRRHDRSIANGWAWGGTEDRGGYLSEQILNTCLFRAYRCLGGDSSDIVRRKWASRYMLYLIIAGIASLATSPITPTPTPVPYVTAMMLADRGEVLGFPGGAVRKVIRWSFEEQGLYQRPGAPTPVTTRGAPPAVDIYIDDGRNGGYNYASTWDQAPGVWNRRAADSGTVHQNPLKGLANYGYVRVRNRGTVTVPSVRVNAYHLADAAISSWPEGFESTTTGPITVTNIAPGGSRLVGPFEWIPLHNSSRDRLLVSVTAAGDRSNIDLASGLACARGPIEIDKLVPYDNNIALRTMTIA
ncbi:hypothetical protein N7462_009643 [Penicillium macrosclerotiorum]|uniref:uncharacterized protein n=1 Tax=Penicillium macrosclerotiorum TaxID=303699 RepID=UPI002547B77B|nr:uncharacterized protein N7462_009643 [Penicillium macrosclerotiorum]KAJ5674204.1 hypothetical protein N7462_009643 [Penicillium macrosclerotiorum]